MVFQRPICNKPINIPSGNYCKFYLCGERFVLQVNNGHAVSYCSYGSDKPTQQNEIEHIDSILQSNTFLAKFNGYLEVMMHTFKFTIVDIMEDGDSNISEQVLRTRLQYIRDNVADDNLLLTYETVNHINCNVKYATIFRNMDYSYKFGTDYSIQPVKKDSNFLIVGEMAEERKNVLYLPVCGYDSYNKIPKSLTRFERTASVKDINELIQRMAQDPAFVKIVRNNINCIEFTLTELQKYYLVAGKCSNNKTYKVFGKVKCSNKFTNIECDISKDVHFDWQLDNKKATLAKYFKKGSVVSCITPRVNSKTLVNVQVLDVKQQIDLEDAITSIAQIDNIPTIQEQKMAKTITGISSKIVIMELINRLQETNDTSYEPLLEQLQELCDNGIHKRPMINEDNFNECMDSASDDDDDGNDNNEEEKIYSPSKKHRMF
nr:hypothetical protein MmNV_68 [Menippe mercenaria nudivirus]